VDPDSDLGEHARRAYQESADRYVARSDANLWNEHWERPFIRSLLPAVSGKRVLDAGCGGGAHTAWLLEQNAEVEAFDIAPRMVELTRERTGDRAAVRVHDMRAPLSFLVEGSIDVVLSSLAISYVRDLRPVFDEFRRVLRPDGAFVCSTHHPFADWRLFGLPDYFTEGVVEDEWAEGVTHRFWRRSLEGLFGPLFDAGFALDAYREGLPSPDVLARFPEARVEPIPNFLFFRAVPVPSSS
jgi:SAM-dependent methyltransferase